MSRIRINTNILPTTNPPTGAVFIGVDSADGELYLKDDAGVVTKFAPSTATGGIQIIGFWDANTNTPDLTAISANQGEAYMVSAAGSTNINGETNWQLKDLVVWDDTLAGNWFKLDNTDDVVSVNGYTGTVVLDKTDIGLGNVDNVQQIPLTEKGVANGVATLDGGGDVPLSQLGNVPAGITNHSGLVLDDGTNPHGTTKSDVGLGNADNTSDLNKPISTATQTALDDKLETVATDATITGDGTVGDPLSVASVGLETKSGKRINIDFLGNPKKTTVTFSTPFADTDYSISLVGVTTGNTAYELTAESVTASTFVINAHRNNIANLTDVRWTATKFGET